MLGPVALLLTVAAAAYAASGESGSSSGDLGVWDMAMGMLGGLALFLFGMEQLADSLKALAGNSLKGVLARLTTNRIMGAITGAFVTACVQSSSVTTVLVVGFITADIMSLSQSVGIILGANIGSTVTAQIIAFKVTRYALLMVAVGFSVSFLAHQEKTKHYGFMCMGMGMIFLGMGMMSTAMYPLRSYPPFLALMAQMETPLLAILTAAVFTGLIQSSAATTGIVIVMAGQGLINLPMGISLVLGANVGTCVTALLASIGKPREAVRASLVHILFNVIGVLIWVGLINRLGDWVVWISPVASGLSGTEKIAAETPRQIANAHTIFNVVNTLIFLPFGAQFARLVEYLVPDREQDRTVHSGAPSEWTAVHLDAALLEMPSMALEQTRGEIGRMGKLVRELVAEIMPAFAESDGDRQATMTELTLEVESIGAQIEEFLIKVSRLNLNRDQSEFTSQMQDVTVHLVEMATLVKKDVIPLLSRKLEAQVSLPEGLQVLLRRYHESIQANVATALEALAENSTERARQVVRAKPELSEMLSDYRAQHYERRRDAMEEAVLSLAIDLDMIDFLRRIYTSAEGMAFTMLSGYLDRRHGRRTPQAQAS